MGQSAIHVLGDVRHACKACGRSCQGIHVLLLDEEDVARVRTHAQALGVADPIRNGRVRQENGRCVFLGPDDLCEIHRRSGFDAKPTVCKQYPYVALKVPEGIRIAIDPGCYCGISSWRTGPPAPDTKLVTNTLPLPPDQGPFEEQLLDLCGMEGMTLAGLASALTGEPPGKGGGLPPAFASRLVTVLKKANIDILLELPDTAPAMRDALGALSRAALGWDPEAPPAWPVLSAEEEAYALDVIQRMIWLRLLHEIPIVAGVALLMLVGAIGCAWTRTSPEEYGASLASWSRALRARTFWRALTPDAASMNWLARGPAFAAPDRDA